MKIAFRRLHRRETDFELLGLGIFAACAVFLAFWSHASLPFPQCGFKMLTGVPCVTCGTTRGAQALLGGNWGAAFLWNPLACLGIFGICLLALYALGVVLFRLPRLRIQDVNPRLALFLRISIIAALAGNWLYVILTQYRSLR